MSVLLQASIGFITGYLVGLFLKAASRIILYIIGGFFAFLLFLQSLGWITIHWSGIISSLQNFLSLILGLGAGNVASLLSVPVFGVSFAAGIYTSYVLPKHSILENDFEFARRR
jgi:uncharacterized membrane protein (Fun14 family)